MINYWAYSDLARQHRDELLADAARERRISEARNVDAASRISPGRFRLSLVGLRRLVPFAACVAAARWTR
jgi:hypothetical protein